MNPILLIAAIIITVLVFFWLVRVARATLGLAIAVAVIVLGLQLLLGVAPREVWQQVLGVWNWILDWFR
jgi:hypothetical protein